MMILWLFGCSEYNLHGDSQPVAGPQPAELWPSVVEDGFQQGDVLASDVLFVIDDSASMVEEQQNLAQNFNAFASYLVDADIDYHVGVVRGDISPSNPGLQGQLVGMPPWVDPETEYGVNTFVSRVMDLGSEGRGDCESGLEASYLALTDPLENGLNAGFYREDALLLVVVVTDEDDAVSLPACDLSMDSPQAWADWFSGLKGGSDRAMLGVIAGFSPSDDVTPSDCESDGLGFADAAPAYRAAADALPGAVTWSICDEDWVPVLSELGLAAAGLRRQFNLSQVPSIDILDWDGDGDTEEPALELALDGAIIEPIWADSPDSTYAWDYDPVQNAIRFALEAIPPPGSELRVSYPNREEAW